MPKARYYQPPTKISLVEGVEKRETAYDDEYTGSAADLSASGLLVPELFPGQQGMPTCSATFRPEGGGSFTAGCMHVTRKLNGLFKISIRVPEEEQQRREAEAERRGSERLKRNAHAKPQSASNSKRLTLTDITHRLTQPSGLVVESYAPRFIRYEGTREQLCGAGVLPAGFAFPKPDPSASNPTWAAADWEDGDFRYWLRKKHVSGEAHKLQDTTADYWSLDVFDQRYEFSDYLRRIAA